MALEKAVGHDCQFWDALVDKCGSSEWLTWRNGGGVGLKSMAWSRLGCPLARLLSVSESLS